MATLLEMAAEIVSSHASTTAMTTEELLLEIQRVHGALKLLESGQDIAVSVAEEEGAPALTVKQAFKKNEVICMVCGKGGFKTLTRHLGTVHNMKPREYRKQFGIPAKQSLAAKSFSEARKKMAEDRGLGDVLAKARETRMANLAAKKAAPAKKSVTKAKSK